MTVRTTTMVLALSALVLAAWANAMDAMEILNRRSQGGGRVSLNYHETPLETVLSDLERYRPGINIRIKARSAEDEKNILALPVSLRLTGVEWDSALKFVAERLRLFVDREEEAAGLIYVEKPERFTDTFNGVPLGVALREIARRGGANVVFSNRVPASEPVYLTFNDVPWRAAFASILKTHACAAEDDAEGGIIRVSTLAEAEAKMETRLRPLRYARADSARLLPEAFWTDPLGLRAAPDGSRDMPEAMPLLDMLEGIKSPGGSVGYEPRTNSLVLMDSQAKLKEMSAIIDAVDVPLDQVLLEMRVVTLDAASASYPEIRWDMDSVWKGESGDGCEPPLGRTGSMSREAVNALCAAARLDPAIHIVQAPEMLVLDGEQASVFVGDLRSRHTSPAERPDLSGTLVGTWMAVMPSISRGNDQIVLEVQPCQTGQSVIDKSGPGGVKYELPVRTNIKAAQTKMVVRSSETVVISGLLDDVDEKGGVQAANAGWFRKSGGKAVPRRNTIILVTPTIVPAVCDTGMDPDVELARRTLATAF